MQRILQKTPWILGVIILENCLFTYHRWQESLAIQAVMPYDSPYVLPPTLVVIVTLIILVISWYLSYSALQSAKEEGNRLEENLDLKASQEAQSKCFFYIRKFFFIQAFAFFFVMTGTDFLVSVFQGIGRMF